MAVTQAMLEEAQAAYHSLQIGSAVAEFRDQNGETVRYAKTDIGKLAVYIEEMKRELNLTTNVGPMRAWF